MATNPYEVEHGIEESTESRHTRRPDMSSFNAHINSIRPDNPSNPTTSSSSAPHHHHVGPTPVDMAALYHLMLDQYATLVITAPTEGNRTFLEGLMETLESDVNHPPDHIPGVEQQYLDTLDRVPKKKLQVNAEDSCPICAERYLDDPYPLVVELPCDGRHTFDLECVGPWLLSKGTCPMCRHNLTKKKTIEIPQDDEEEEDDADGMYG